MEKKKKEYTFQCRHAGSTCQGAHKPVDHNQRKKILHAAAKINNNKQRKPSPTPKLS